MSKSYRIRTQVGVDKAVNVSLEQDFESLEILSLKILQNQIYTRQCSDYGVVVGRVSANNGFGLPNVKVSIFVPLSDEDELDPIISELYPYKTLNDLNEDGYRYNLLPYEVSHGGHTPTGTFPSREDVLVNQGLIEVFDKYYKYTAKTNDSGDFMIFGVPIGPQTLHIDVDLSDIGEFSLSPQDLIRLNLATEGQVAGTKFRSATNLGELPQIKQANRTVEVVPLWGQPEICYLGITRIDFDLAQEFGIKIEPAAIFMGSILSNGDDKIVKRNCKSDKKIGNLCSMTTGPGQILSIRQTISQDNLGRPVLESFPLENGGNCIDENGTWLIDLPMNLDYVYTSESGERLISTDPSIGIPTKARYRFKVKWQQPPTLTGKILRGSYLVPNIKEWGWVDTNVDPTTTNTITIGDVFFNTCRQPDNSFVTNPPYTIVKASYSFSLDWNDYGAGPNANLMINEAITCQDRFFEFQHSKVYTISSLITEFRASRGNDYRYIAIKDILNTECESTTNTFPANDGQKNNDFIYLLFTFLLSILIPLMFLVIIIGHLIALIMCILAFILGTLKLLICGLADAFCWITELEILEVRPFGFLGFICRLLQGLCDPLEDAYEKMMEYCGGFGINLPVMVYPDCEFCPCDDPKTESEPADLGDLGFPGLEESLQNAGGTNLLTDFHSPSAWECNRTPQWFDIITGPAGSLGPIQCPTYDQNIDVYLGSLQSGQPGLNAPQFLAPQLQTIISDDFDPEIGLGDIIFSTAQSGNVDKWTLFTTSIPFFERANLLNTKAKYFDQTISSANDNPGSGFNRIKVRFASDNPANAGSFHLDNVVILFVKKSQIDEFESGSIFTPVQKKYSQDTNLLIPGATTFNQFGTTSVTGTTLGTPIYEPFHDPLTDNPEDDIIYYTHDITVNYANPNNTGNLSTSYTISATTGDDEAGGLVYRFPSDIEYFQAITGMTIADFKTLSSTGGNGIRGRIIDSYMDIVHEVFDDGGGLFGGGDNGNVTSLFYDPDTTNGAYYSMGNQNGNPLKWNCFDPDNETGVVFLVRGVDPYSTRQTCSYDLSMLFGEPFDTPGFTFEGQFKLNIPIQGGLRNVRHGSPSTITNSSPDTYSNTHLFYPSYSFLPDSSMYQTYTTTATSYYLRGDFADNIFPAGVSSYSNALRVNTTNWYALTFAHRWGGYYYTEDNAPDGQGRFLLGCKSTWPDGGGAPEFNSVSNGRNRGYFLDEIIEGAAVMRGDFSSYQPSHVNLPVVGSATICRAGSPSVLSNYFSYSYHSYSTNPADYTVTMSDPQRIVMRGDRIPTSSVEQINGNCSYGLHGGQTFTLFPVGDDGYVDAGPPGGGSSEAGSANNISENPTLSGAGNTFSCEGLIPLACYDTDANGFTTVKPADDDCYTNVQGENYIKGGCYRLIQVPIVSLPKDFQLLAEWSARTKLGFAACRNIYGLIFTNYWINGTLFMFPIKNVVRYTGPNDDPSNAPYLCICPDLMFVDNTTNNAYYRSAPYRYGIPGATNGFVGKDSPTNFSGPQSEVPNYRNLLFPTTIMDLGPRAKYTTELVLSDEYLGYVMDRMSTTSYQDTSDLLNQFIMSRLLSQTLIGMILQQLVPVAGVLGDPVRRMFSRAYNKVDGDYAQMVAINSQLGVFPYDVDEYLTPNPSAVPSAPSGYLYINPSDSKYNVFGVFFQQNYELRDWLSPHRLLTTPTGATDNECTYEDYPIFTQQVPFYQWYIQPNRDSIPGLFAANPLTDSIFGDQQNDWWTPQEATEEAGGPNIFFATNYQGMDRRGSEFMQPQNTNVYGFHGGYLFNVNNSGQVSAQPPNPNNMPDYKVQFDNDIFTITDDEFRARIMTPSGPYYFYFGLNKGKSAFDRFLTKWIRSDVFEF